jgi:CheY-like chemotaxis protein
VVPQQVPEYVGRILVVDDEPIVRQMLELVLASDGWLVEQAASGEEGLERCRSELFDVVILDHWMPTLTGFEVAGRLVEEGCSMPLVIFSAFLDLELKEACEAIGVHPIDKLDWKGLVHHCRLVALGRVAASTA